MPDEAWDELPRSSIRRRWSLMPKSKRMFEWKEANPLERSALVDAIPKEELPIKSNKERRRREVRSPPIPPGSHSGQKEQSTRNSEEDELSDSQRQEELTRIHRDLTEIHHEVIESSLNDIRENLQAHAKISQVRSQRRRAENIYVLVAIGIITGFFTVYPQFRISTRPFDILATAITLASGLFLFIKLHTVSSSQTGEGNISTYADRLAGLLFRLSITGAFLLGVSSAVVNVLDIDLTTLGAQVSQIAAISVFLATIIFTYFTRELTIQLNNRPRESTSNLNFQDMHDLMFDLTEFDNSREGAEEFIESIQEFAPHSSTDQLEQIRDRVSKLDIQRDVRKEIRDKLTEIIEEKRMESKSDEELREMRRDELRNEQDRFRESPDG